MENIPFPIEVDKLIIPSAEPSMLPVYTFWNLALMFFIFSLIGWVWEVIYTAVTEKVVAKRGILHGPWLPLYGVGGVLILLLLNRYKSAPLLVFVLAMILCGTVEYVTGIIIERLYGKRWWDYSTKRVHIKGRICLGGVLLFGAAGAAAVCGFGPVLNDQINLMRFPIQAGVVVVLSIAFLVDVMVSAMTPNDGKGVTYDIPEELRQKHTEGDNEKKDK